MVNFQSFNDELTTIAENVARTARIAPTIADLGEGVRLVMQIDKKTGKRRLAIFSDHPISRELWIAVWAAFRIPLSVSIRFHDDSEPGDPVVEWAWTVKEEAVAA